MNQLESNHEFISSFKNDGCKKNMTQSEIKRFLDDRSESIQMKDIDRLMSHYSADIIYFDLVPPLQYVGSAALRDRFLEWFDGYKSEIRQEIRDLHVFVSGDVAVTSMLIRSGGTLKSGREVELWVRATSSCQRSDGSWLIMHEHVSMPVDLSSGSAVMNLTP